MKIAIVTGASSGIGSEFVKQIGHFYNDLDEIWVVARRKERLLELETMQSVPIRIFASDLSKDEGFLELQEALLKWKPDLRMLVNSAGFGKVGSFESILKKEPDSQFEMIDLNCKGLTKMTALCLPYLSKGSRILNIASGAAFCPQSGFAVYAATKSFVLSFSRGLNAELASKNIYITAVCPGPVDTEFFLTSGSNHSLVKQKTMAKKEDIVRKALIDAKNKKEVSIYGAAMKSANAAAKILPHGLVIQIMKHIGNISK